MGIKIASAICGASIWGKGKNPAGRTIGAVVTPFYYFQTAQGLVPGCIIALQCRARICCDLSSLNHQAQGWKVYRLAVEVKTFVEELTPAVKTITGPERQSLLNSPRPKLGRSHTYTFTFWEED
ncbi:hypothetical protein KOEU_23120 [Komagataeibacter europaeus]|uniref:Uncharacterized protein n=1 Tax=Komagataeibacter europaeus TaxID=33995 RepID=A0A0M0EG44_KOMEU|nr:hypothetical protein KOEU_23120 [Komagataeibacter europaeus]